ncbi:MAG TPA: EamA family transporter [Candidatus Nanoarchaeia archaeon]|nr:EamA family transporter [Candidatus Nanoarchaeia archaeon]
MIWVILPIAAGFFDSVFYSVLKKLSGIDIYAKIALLNIITVPFLALGFIFFNIPKIASMFYLVIFINIIIFFIAQMLMIKSLEVSNLSISIPMLSFTPVFLLLTSYLMLNEFPSLAGLFGVLLVVLGSYVLNIHGAKHGYLDPVKSIFKNKGIFYMVIVAFLYSLCANLGKIGVNLSNPAYYMFMFYLIYSMLLFVIFYKKVKSNITILGKNLNYFVFGGFSTAASEILIGIAYKYSIVPYIISLKRTSILFAVLIGIFLFKEKNIKQAILGSAIMFVGVLIITLS